MKRKNEKWFDPAIIKEDESKTTAYEKHFILNNGTRKAVFSPTNMNYYDKTENKWKAIDNTLKSAEGGYLAAIGDYTAKVSKAGDKEAVELTNGSDAISWEYLGTHKNVFSAPSVLAAETAAKPKSRLSVKARNSDALHISRAGQAVYKNAAGGIDLDYRFEGNGIKENIMIKDKSESYRYYFLLHISGFDMKLAEKEGDIGFYRKNADAEADDPGVPEFIMPAPFMYDANGSRSNAVRYAFENMGNGNYVFSVEADAEWINAPERIFPVCVDPQLLPVDSSYITVSHAKYQHAECSGSPCCGAAEEWEQVEDETYYGNCVCLKIGNCCKINATLHVRKPDVDFTRNKLISAKLIFPVYEGKYYSDSATIKIGTLSYSHRGSGQMIADITGIYDPSKDVSLEMQISNGERLFAIPTLQIEYQSDSAYPICKSFAVEKGATTEMNVISGDTTTVLEDISDPRLGISVSHVYKPNDEIPEYGRNFRLNLDEKLKKTSSSSVGAVYVYTDPQGDKHTFKEHFCRIGANGEKVYISSPISSITADTDGRLWLDDTEVFRELTTDRGLRASSKLEGVNNAEWVEQRSDEEKQVEEQVKAYRNTLHNFVSVDKKTGSISKRLKAISLNSPDAMEEFLNQVECTSHLLLSEEEAMAFKSLLTQNNSLETTNQVFEKQLVSLAENVRSLLIQYRAPATFDYQRKSLAVQRQAQALECEEMKYQKNKDSDRSNYYQSQLTLIGSPNDTGDTKYGLINKNEDLISQQESNWNSQKAWIENQIKGYPLWPEKDVPKGYGELCKQFDSIKAQQNAVSKQIYDICLQINLYIQKSAKYIEQVKGYYKEYLNLQNRLDLLRAQVPVSYLISDDVIKGFNAKGDLVIVQDKYGKYVVMERRKYNAAGATRISAIYDKDGNTMSFLYNENDRLSQIGNSLGERVSFRYDDDGYLTGIEREKLPALTLEYISLTSGKRIKKISSSDQTFTSFSYNLMGMLTQITGNTAVSAISHRNIVLDKDSVLSTVKIAYTDTDTEITYDKTKQEIYRVDQEAEQVVAYYETINGLVTKAENYTYTGNLLTRTEYAHRSCLNRYGVADFAENFMPETIKETTYNSFREPTATDVLRYESSPDFAPPAERTQTEYTYNDDHRLTMTRATHQYFESNSVCSSSVAVEKYYYNNMGETVRTESYVEGEELKTGIRIEEHEFNEDGVEIRTVTRNSLDPSSGFYTEQEVDKEGRTLAAFDESGKHKTAYEYMCDGVNVRSEHLPNGSVLSYGRAKDDTVNAVTHSTDAGEENSTTRLSTLDAITEVRSGTHTVGYTYDGKRRISSVSLYGKDNYVKYTYSGEHTNAEKVRAELADGTVFTSVKDLSGNVTQTTCGDRSVNNTYNTDRQLTESVDSVSGTTAITYDAKGNIQTVTAPGCAESYTYDVIENFLMSRTVSDGDFTHNYAYSYKQTADRALDHMTVDGKTVTPATDALGRNTGKTIAVGGTRIAEEKISYVKSGDHATNMPSTIRFASPFNGTYGFNESIQYRYDAMGNIIEVSENGRPVCRYEYDALGRLTREDNKALQKTICFAYDNGGNILARYEYALTSSPTEELYPLESSCKAYVYEKDSDRLLSYNGESFAYDTIGNPTTYRGKSATWAYGRQLTAFNGNTFAYDARGRRTGKNNLTFTYDSNGNLVKQSNGLEFLYDHTGIFAIKYNNSTYFYRKNAQQDVIALLDNTGKVVVKYRYDAWGKCQTAVTDDNASMIAELNPFRYRSYYYDTETGFYFLQTRYYDPEIGRFMTIDDVSYLDPESINGLNLYAYCLNNPVMYVDSTGHFPILALILGIIALVGLGLTIGGVASENNTLTAVGLTMVAIPALISGGMAIAAGIGGATLTGIVGGVTTVAGIGSGLFASAEYQEAFTGANWMLDAGMSESWYNGLMLTTAVIATLGTFASSFCYNFNIKSIGKIGKLIPSNHPNEGYWGIRFKNARGALRSLELQNHVPHGLHFQLNSWNPMHMSVKTIRRWTWFLTRM